MNPIKTDLAFAIRDNFRLKHLQGKHDQSTHGSWANGKRIQEDTPQYRTAADVRKHVLTNTNISDDDGENELKAQGGIILDQMHRLWIRYAGDKTTPDYNERRKSLQDQLDQNEAAVKKLQENNAQIMWETLRSLPEENYTGKATVSAHAKSIHQPTPENTKEILDNVNRVLECTDVSDWQDNPKFVRIWMTNMGGGSYFSEKTNRINIGYASDTGIPSMGKIAVHELGHWIEKRNPDISSRAEEIFINRMKREADERYKKGGYKPLLDDLIQTKYARYERDGKKISVELYRYYPDKFQDEYMGRVYRYDGGTQFGAEFFSMSLEYLFYNPKRMAREDPEMFDFTVWALTGKK